MGEHLDWYRQEICKREAHKHGDDGEMTCLLLRLADLKARHVRGGNPEC